MITGDTYFIDIEVEGKYKGEKTLFIVDYYDSTKIENILNNDQNISQIYFGAGFQSKIKDFEVVRYFVNKDIIVSIEVLSLKDVPNDLLLDNRCHKILTIRQDNHMDYTNNFTLKIENNKGIFCFISAIYNSWKAYNNS